MNIKTRIIKVKGNWKEVLNDCRFTVNKPDVDKEPSEEFKKKILRAEHSPIRGIIFKWEWLQIPTWVTTHWVRHIWEKYVGTQRTDKTGNKRGMQDDPSNMRGEANVQHLIDTSRKRLCFKASKETRECAESLKLEIHNVDKYIGDVMVPNCIYRGGCPEYSKVEENKCTYYDFFVKLAEKKNVDLSDIQARYDLYNSIFYDGFK